MKRLFVSIAIALGLMSGGVAAAYSSDANGSSPPPQANYRVGDPVNGGRIVEVNGEVIVVQFDEPVAPR